MGRTVRILAGFPPGGQIDAVARMLVEALRGPYAAAVVMENRPGAADRLALEAAWAAEPDGTTLVLTPSDKLVYFGHVYGGRLCYDLFADFAPVAGLCAYRIGFATGPATPANSLAEFIARVKDKPSIPFGIPGPGTLPHFMGILMPGIQVVDILHLEGDVVEPGAVVLAEHHDVVVDEVVAAVGAVEAGEQCLGVVLGVHVLRHQEAEMAADPGNRPGDVRRADHRMADALHLTGARIDALQLAEPAAALAGVEHAVAFRQRRHAGDAVHTSMVKPLRSFSRTRWPPPGSFDGSTPEAPAASRVKRCRSDSLSAWKAVPSTRSGPRSVTWTWCASPVLRM